MNRYCPPGLSDAERVCLVGYQAATLALRFDAPACGGLRFTGVTVVPGWEPPPSAGVAHATTLWAFVDGAQALAPTFGEARDVVLGMVDRGDRLAWARRYLPVPRRPHGLRNAAIETLLTGGASPRTTPWPPPSDSPLAPTPPTGTLYEANLGMELEPLGVGLALCRVGVVSGPPVPAGLRFWANAAGARAAALSLADAEDQVRWRVWTRPFLAWARDYVARPSRDWKLDEPAA